LLVKWEFLKFFCKFVKNFESYCAAMSSLAAAVAIQTKITRLHQSTIDELVKFNERLAKDLVERKDQGTAQSPSNGRPPSSSDLN